MTIQAGVWGIDLGQCALKAMRLEVIDGQVTATAFDYVEHPKILSQPDADPDQLTREALEKFLSRNSLKGDLVAISIPGQSGLARFVKLPPVEEKKITDIVRFEAKQQIPFNLDEVVWDYQKIGSGVVTDGFAMETEIGLFAIKRDTVNRYLQHFKDVNVEVHLVQMTPLALCNFVSYDLLQAATEGEEDTKGCVVALDIGADNSNLVITDAGKIIWQRPIPLGGNHFTRALTKDLKLTFAKAEHLKRNATKSPDLKKILASLKPVLNDFVGEVQRSLGYFTNTHRDANIQYMIGLGNAFRLPGLQKFISEKLSLEVRKLQKLERLVGDPVVNAPVFTENVLSFAVPYGLALQGLGLPRLHTNLLPQEIRMERLIRAKKPWAVGAAAALLFGTSIWMVGDALQYRAVAAPQVKEAITRGDSVKKEAGDWQNKCKSEEDKIEAAKKAVKSIIAGQEERLNWIQLMSFINEAVPQPNASNLSEAARKFYYLGNEKAQKAAASFYDHYAGKVRAGDAKPDEEEGIQHRIQVNIDTINCRYSQDLAGYNDKLKSMNIDTSTMLKKDLDKAPEGKGWVVELRGYTYHLNQRRFIVETFLDNLKRLRVKEDLATASESGAPGVPAGAPTVAQAPAPATPPATPDGTSPSADGSDKPPAPEDPLLNKVSHVVLYAYRWVADPDPNSFVLINDSVAGEIAAAGPAGAGGAGGLTPSGPSGDGGFGISRGMGGGMGGSADSWSPLGGGGGGGIGGGMGGMGIGPGGSGTGRPSTSMGMMGMRGSGTSMPSTMGSGNRGAFGGSSGRGYGGIGGRGTPSGAVPPGMPGSGDGGPDGENDPRVKKARVTRTEFIIVFVWKEPTPSDALRTVVDEAPVASGFGDGGMGMGGSPGRGDR